MLGANFLDKKWLNKNCWKNETSSTATIPTANFCVENPTDGKQLANFVTKMPPCKSKELIVHVKKLTQTFKRVLRANESGMRGDIIESTCS